jgi:zinc transport system substrate-binding protein
MEILKKNIKSIVLFSAAAIILAGCQAKPVDSNKLQVAASFYPLYYFASQIGGDKAEVINITPTGAEPHDYEPTARDIALIEQSQMLILNGLGLESWGQSIQQNINPQKTLLVFAKEGMIDGQMLDNEVDPHIWLSPLVAENIVKNIADGFIKIDPANAQYYQANAENLKSKLENLDAAYRSDLANCRLKDFVTSHAAFGYLASTYGLKQINIAGLSPDAEPSPAQLAAITNIVKDKGIKYLFFESLASPKLAETIAAETGAQTLVLNPLEGLTKTEITQGKDYFTVMQDNLTNLQTALECQK